MAKTFDLTDEELDAFASWMAYEIMCPFSMDKSCYKKSYPRDVFRISYRKSVWLCHEHITIVALFIKHILYEFNKTGKTTGFDWLGILETLTEMIGMKNSLIDYSRDIDLRAICMSFTEKFPDFVKLVEEGDF